MNQYDFSQTETWLNALGKNGDTRVRAIVKGTAPEGVKRSLKFNVSRLKDPVFVEQLIQENRNIYAVVNPGGDEAADIQHCIALFAEHDDLPTQKGLMPKLTADSTPEEYAEYSKLNRQLSWDLVRGLVTEGKLPKPTMCVDTGGKSLQWFWRLKNPIQDKQAWTALQRRLIQLLHSDPIIIDAPRLMRLPGFPHATTQSLCTVHKVWTDLDDNFDVFYLTSDTDNFDALLPELIEQVEAETTAEDEAELNERHKKSKANQWFDLLSPSEQMLCMAEMLAHVWRMTADSESSHMERLKIVAGLTHYLGSPDKMRDLWRLAAEKHDISWDKTTKTDMFTWALEILKRGKGKSRSIGSAIRVAYGYGWVGREWKRRLANDSDHLQTMVYNELFNAGEGWLTTMGVSYQKVDNYYLERSDGSLGRQVLDYLADTEDYASKASHQSSVGIVNYLKTRTNSEASANPDGYISCTNGILEIKKGGHRRLIPHDSDEARDLIFFDPPSFAYDPNADRTYAERLLECLPDQPRELFLRAMAFSLNYAEAAAYYGHSIALFSTGDGSNGKDTNAAILERIFGANAIGRVDLKEFHAVDKERSFELLKLRHCRLNLPSETPSGMKIDHLKTLKAFVTGNTVKGEEKGKNSVSFKPRLTMMFNTNDSILLNNIKEADRRRYYAIHWPFIYTKDPEKLEQYPDKYRLADTRYLGISVEDSEWLNKYVLPGYFNILLEAFERVCAQGFLDLQDYSNTVIKRMGEDINHFKAFLAEIVDWPTTNQKHTESYHEDSVSANEIFEALYKPYCLDIGRAKKDADFYGPREINLSQTQFSSDKTCMNVSDMVTRMQRDSNIKCSRPSASVSTKYGISRAMTPQKLFLKPEAMEKILEYRKTNH